jgi:hypothetical protein
MSVPIHDFAIANEELVNMNMETAQYYTCCGKRVCHGCTYSFIMSGNFDKCPFCNSEFMGKTCEKRVQDMMKRVDANDAGAMCHWAVIITMEMVLCSRIGKRHWNFTLGQLNLVPARLISYWVVIIMKGGFEVGQVPLRSCGYGRSRSSKKQPWNHGGTVW